MARCKECCEEFEVSAEEQRLIVTKKMEELCMECAMQRYQNKEDDFVATPPLIPRKQSIPRGPKRVNWFDGLGKLRAFMSIPPPRLYPAHVLNRLQKPGRLHAFVFHPAPDKMASEPTTLLFTNVDRFQSRKEDFWVKKAPECYDSFTGIGKIVIPYREIVRSEFLPEEKTVYTKDGGCVRISYVW